MSAFLQNIFICMLMSKERPVRHFIGKRFSLRGKEVKVTNCLPSCLHRSTLILDGSGTVQVKLRLERSIPDPSKTRVKARRGVQENTRQYREVKEANVIYLVLLSNI